MAVIQEWRVSYMQVEIVMIVRVVPSPSLMFFHWAARPTRFCAGAE